MIVLCPTCHTRYRHDPDPAAGAATAECSRCDETIPLVAPRRTYVLLPSDPAPAGQGRLVPAGMDDPTLAERLSRTLPTVPDPAVIRVPEPVEALADGAESGADTTGEAPGWRRSEALELGIAIAPSALCALVAYYLAGQQNQDPVTWSALGGAAGLLMGWLCLLWMQRNR